MSEKCTECGCIFAECTKNDNKHISDVHLHEEIERLRRSLMEKNSHIVKIETQFLNEADKFPNGELASMKEEILTWQEKYSRLYEAHKRIQKVNQNLEDKLLKIVDKCETEKGAFTKDIATLSHRLADANYTIHRLSQDNSKYRNDVNLAIQLLQCKPSNFVGQKYDSLPTEVQAKVRNYVTQKRRSSSTDQSLPDVKSITVPISTFPPTAMVYNITKASVDKHSDDESDGDKPPVDIVSAAIMAKVLEDRERERIFAKHCDTCACHKAILMVNSESQTITSYFTDNLSGINHKMYAIRKSDEIKRHTLNNTGICTKINQNLPTQIKIERQSKAAVINIMKQNKPNKRIETHTDIKVNPQCSQVVDTYDATPIEIINDRIWKNNWTQSKFDNSEMHKATDNKRNKGIHLDVINERVWKNDTDNINNVNQVTLIEVTNAVNANHQVSDTVASPSFSSDSVLISSSEPSSSSSDLVQSINKKRLLNNSENKERLTGPRNCFVRVSREGSKNILLDNAGHYQTVLYTSPGSGSGSAEQTNTALVHNLNKSPHSTRSSSTSSDEAFPILPNDATQLQRVAEWVQSSVGASEKATTGPKSDAADPLPPSISEQCNKGTKPPCTHIEMSAHNFADRNVASKTQSFEVVGIAEQVVNSSVIADNNVEQHIYTKPELEVKDLISFDSNNEDEAEDKEMDGESLLNNGTDVDYEVQITKEMEETYLKLAASLDPVSLRLSTGIDADLTIEKYRKNHKKVQVPKINEKSEMTT